MNCYVIMITDARYNMTPTYLLSGLWETYSETKIRGVSLWATDSIECKSHSKIILNISRCESVNWSLSLACMSVRSITQTSTVSN